MPLFLNREGNVSESSGACVFAIQKNKLLTPPLSADILDSITRQMIIKISKKILNIETLEKNITKDSLLESDEVFLCGTSIEIFPVNRIENTTFKVGENTITLKLKNLFFDIVRNKTQYTNLFLKKL